MKLNRWILFGVPTVMAGLMLVGASFSVGGPKLALAGEFTPTNTPVPACDATATPTIVVSLNDQQGGNLSAFQAPPDTATPTCTPTPRIRTHTPTPEPTEEDTATPAPSNTPAPPPATNTPTGRGAGAIQPPDTGTGDGTPGSNTALIWLASGLALAVAGGGAFLVGVRRRS